MLTTRYYGLVDADGFITQSTAREVDDEAEAPRFATSQNYQPLSGPVDWSAQPTPTSRLRYLGAEVAPEWEETATFDAIKAGKTAEINAAKEAANRDYFMFRGARIQADASSMLEIMTTNGWVALTGDFHPGFPKAWKTADNGYVPIPDVAAWREFYGAIAATGQANFDYAQTLKAQLVDATTPEQIAAITWGAGPQPPEEV